MNIENNTIVNKDHLKIIDNNYNKKDKENLIKDKDKDEDEDDYVEREKALFEKLENSYLLSV